MKRILFFILFIDSLSANPKENMDLLLKDKKEYRNLDLESIEARYKSLKYSFITNIELSSSLGINHYFDEDKNRNYTKSASIGINQTLFESGAIIFKMDYANSKYDYDTLSWQNQNQQLIFSIYSTLLDIKKLKLEHKQNNYKILNKNIELEMKKLEYDVGKSDIIDLNNAIMSKNSALNEKISLENSIKDKEQELAKYTELKYEEIEILDFKETKKDEFLDSNFELLQEEAKIKMLDSDYKKQRGENLMKLSLNAKATYSNSDEKFNPLMKDNSRNDAQSSATLNLSIPLFDYSKSKNVQESKIESMKQRFYLADLKNEKAFEYDQYFTKIDTFFKQNEILKDNILLYDDLIEASSISSSAGMTSKYDLEILENQKAINSFDILINNINVMQYYAKIYFMTKG
ncbi:outer membrane channel protein [Aliarcobacter thereius]|uniref:Outer membrane channel protein n=1 Tax=Aliarcobacter thereius TaxID=544718 RepID=A0A1C0B5Z8_9BACT|nr:TolC family protein [Aliarcobacter thereius]OCL98591.1 outer membrane channel protein [Aliarcobacter thereius]